MDAVFVIFVEWLAVCCPKKFRVMAPERGAGEGVVQNAQEAQQEKDET